MSTLGQAPPGSHSRKEPQPNTKYKHKMSLACSISNGYNIAKERQPASQVCQSRTASVYWADHPLGDIPADRKDWASLCCMELLSFREQRHNAPSCDTTVARKPPRRKSLTHERFSCPGRGRTARKVTLPKSCMVLVHSWGPESPGGAGSAVGPHSLLQTNMPAWGRQRLW